MLWQTQHGRTCPGTAQSETQYNTKIWCCTLQVLILWSWTDMQCWSQLYNYQRTQQEMHLSCRTFPFPCFGIFAFSMLSPYEKRIACVFAVFESLICFCCLWSPTVLFDSVKCLFPHQLHFLIIAHLDVKLYSDLLLLSGDLICLVQHITYFYCLSELHSRHWHLWCKGNRPPMPSNAYNVINRSFLIFRQPVC